MSFVLTQSTGDIQILQYIQSVLGFGSVLVQSRVNNTHRFVVQNQSDLYLVCLLFNGNLVFPVRQQKFLDFLVAYNRYISGGRLSLSAITPILSSVMPTLQQAWLAGLTDAEGCFSGSLLKSSNGFRIRYLLAQKWDTNKPILEHIVFLFGAGSVEKHSAPHVWELRVNGLANCTAIFDYFKAFPLISMKGESYKRFLELHARLTAKDHLDPLKRSDVKALAASINTRKK